MVWTLLLLFTVGWLLTLLTGAGAPLSWLFPAVIAVLILYRVIGARRSG